MKIPIRQKNILKKR